MVEQSELLAAEARVRGRLVKEYQNRGLEVPVATVIGTAIIILREDVPLTRENIDLLHIKNLMPVATSRRRQRLWG